MPNGKDMIIHLIVELMRKTLYKNKSVLSKPFRGFRGNISVKVDLSNFATKTDLKNVTHVDTSSFAMKTNLASL